MTDQYCVIGNPIAQSKSPVIHPRYAAQTGQDIAYERVLAPVDDFAGTVAGLVARGLRGANVTMPFKLEAFALSTRLTPRAQAAGAVNTLSFEGSEIIGDNTDGAGLVADIVRNAGVAIAGKRVLLLGAGGAARGALQPLLAEGPRELVIVNRTRAIADALAQQFDGVTARDFAELDAPFDIVINATAASMAAAMPPVPAIVFGHGTLALDMMYAKDPTVFMQFAQSRGATVRDGLGMLVEQAAEAFFVWRGVRPDTGPTLAFMRTAL
jgi:shikimate dehydrogenase